MRAELLDGDVIRQNISAGLTFSPEDRKANIHRISFICHLLSRNGILNIVAATSPYRDSREQARRMIGNFVEVYVKCPLEVCAQRDDKHLYAQASEGKLKEMAGKDIPYEEPRAPEVVCETDRESPEACVEKVLAYLRQKGLIPPESA